MPIRPSQPSYTVDEVVPLLGLGRHQLRGLVERRVITPSVTTGYRGPGGKRRFSRLDIVAIRSGCELMRLGLVGAGLKRACQTIRRIEEDGLQRALLLITHTGRVLHV